MPTRERRIATEERRGEAPRTFGQTLINTCCGVVLAAAIGAMAWVGDRISTLSVDVAALKVQSDVTAKAVVRIEERLFALPRRAEP